MDIRHGRGGKREVIVRWNATIDTALTEGSRLFDRAPNGYRAERLTLARQRGRRGARIDCTVVYYKVNENTQPLDLVDFEIWSARVIAGDHEN